MSNTSWGKSEEEKTQNTGKIPSFVSQDKYFSDVK